MSHYSNQLDRTAKDWPSDNRISVIGHNGNTGCHYPTITEYHKDKQAVKKVDPIIHGGEIVRHCRKVKGKTQAELAKLYGVSTVALGRWERLQVSVFWHDVYGICGALGFSAVEVMQITLDLMKKAKK